MSEENESEVKELTSLISAVKVSSVLNNDVKSFGKQFIFDNNPETCWNSDKDSPQSFAVKFSSKVYITSMKIMFQGGFAPKVSFLHTFKHFSQSFSFLDNVG